MRDRFHEQLQQLSEALITMGALCEEAISDAAKSYFTGDRRLGERAGQLEQQIDQQQRDIEGLCMQLLLRQQPVARDLRTISAAMRMISDMERIGDQAADIAEIARDVQAGKLADETPMGDMARTAISMVTDSVDAFVRQDLDLAHQVIARDDKVDSPVPEHAGAAGGHDRPGGGRRRLSGHADDRQVLRAHRGPRLQHRPVGGVCPHRSV